jgi:F0F1-type ATP synthase membrane subunit b/b'
MIFFVMESEAVYAPPSSDSKKRADEIIARGLKRAMQEPEQTPEEIWSEFDALREKMRNQAQEIEQRAKRNQHSA